MILLYEKFKKIKKFNKHSELDDKFGISNVIKNIEIDKSEKSSDKVLDKILNKIKNKYNLSGDIKYSNAGSYGITFIVGDKVIKITSETNEAKMAKKLVGKKIKFIVNYYGVSILPHSLYAIVMDRCVPLSEDECDLFDDYIDGIDVFDKDSIDLFKSDLDTMNNKLSKKLEKMFKDYKKMVKGLNDANIKSCDMHPGNLGYFKGNMVHFDMMSSSSVKDVSKISKI